MTSVHVIGTTDSTEIAAVLAVISAALGRRPEPNPYERWRSGRIAAVGRDLNKS